MGLMIESRTSGRQVYSYLDETDNRAEPRSEIVNLWC